MTVVETFKTPEKSFTQETWVSDEPIPVEGFSIDTSQTLPLNEVPLEQIKRLTAADTPVVAVIGSGLDYYLLVDSHASKRYNTPFILVDATNFTAASLKVDEDLVVGKQRPKDGSNHPGDELRDQFSLHLSSETKELVVHNLNPSHDTYFTGHLAGEPEEYRKPVVANFTENAKRFIKESKHYKPSDGVALDGYFHEHPLITRNSPSVRNGVYGSKGSEYVIVDVEEGKDSATYEVLNAVMDELHALDKEAPNFTLQVLTLIERRVSDTLRYDEKATNALSEPYYEGQGMVELSRYIEAGIGVCRHQALLTALILEYAIEEELLEGTIAVERNAEFETDIGHAWAVFKQHNGPDIIIDPAQHFVGTRERAAKFPGRWPYVVSDES